MYGFESRVYVYMLVRDEEGRFAVAERGWAGCFLSFCLLCSVLKVYMMMRLE